MSFREKSAWTMALVMIVTGAFYVWLVSHAPMAPVIGPLLPYVLAVIVLSVAFQILLAILSPKEAQAGADEREKLVIARAGHWAGMILAVLLMLAGGVYVVHPTGNMLFHHFLGALIVGQTAEYLFQIYFLRRAI